MSAVEFAYEGRFGDQTDSRHSSDHSNESDSSTQAYCSPPRLFKMPTFSYLNIDCFDNGHHINDTVQPKPVLTSILKNSRSVQSSSSFSSLNNNNNTPFGFVIKKIGRCNIEIPHELIEATQREAGSQEEDQTERMKKGLYWKVHALIKEKKNIFVCQIRNEFISRYRESLNPMDQFGLTWTAVCELPYSKDLQINDLGQVVYTKKY